MLSAYDASQAVTKSDLFLMPLQGAIKLITVLETAANESGGHFSFDGRFIAYRSDSSGAQEVYVRAFNSSGATLPSVGEATRVSNGGVLVSPRWRSDDAELYYVAPDGSVMAVPMNTTSFQVGAPIKLFQVPPAFIKAIPGPAQSMEMSHDGQRFVLLLQAK